jgi:hypothetical protein
MPAADGSTFGKTLAKKTHENESRMRVGRTSRLAARGHELLSRPSHRQITRTTIIIAKKLIAYSASVRAVSSGRRRYCPISRIAIVPAIQIARPSGSMFSQPRRGVLFSQPRRGVIM